MWLLATTFYLINGMTYTVYEKQPHKTKSICIAKGTHSVSGLKEGAKFECLFVKGRNWK